MNYLQKIKGREELRSIIEHAKASGKIVVQCHGCFDILHPGHLRHLTWAKEQGDLLVVSVSADSVVNKGNLRPYVPQQLRAENLAALEIVDYVVIDDNEWAGPILELLQPNIYVKGKEFQDVYTGRIGRERQVVESYGGQVRFSSGDVVYSSSKIIHDFKDRLHSGLDQVESFCKRHKLTRTRLSEIISQFDGKNIVVIGDTIVDRYIYCDRLGMSADAPVLVVRPLEMETFLGGAGIVAQHIRNLGATVKFCTVVGQDLEGEYVRRELERRRIPHEIVVDATRPTTLKTRYLCESKKLLNVNQFRDHNLGGVEENQLRTKVKPLIGDADAIVICDFSYGVITRSLLETLCTWGRERKIPIIGDVQCSSQMGNVTRMKGITLIAPSEKEARMALCDRESGIADLGAMILTQTQNRALIITMAERGLMVFEPEDGPFDEASRVLPLHEIKKRLTTEYLPPFANIVTDAMGAGDAMLAAISCSLATGANVMESAFLGNCAAAVEVGKMGNVPIAREELINILAEQFSTIKF